MTTRQISVVVDDGPCRPACRVLERASTDCGSVELAFVGVLCTATVARLRPALRRWADATPANSVVVDLTDVTFIDARGITLLLELRGRAAARNRSFGLSPQRSDCVRRLLEICRLTGKLALPNRRSMPELDQ